MTINLNQSPIWDDFSEDKGFLKILFRPGYAVQARELTQIQSILQNQISRHGSFTFKSGSQVLGGQLTYDPNVISLNVAAAYANVSLTNFANSVITDSSNTIRAQVIATAPQISGSNDPSTLLIKYLTGVTFTGSSNVHVEGNFSANLVLASNNSYANASVVSLNEGVFFIDLKNLNPTSNANANSVPVSTNAFFVRVPSQTLILNKYNNVPSYRIGLQISDAIVDEQADASLLDPALQSSNYQAPGATRYIITAVLSSRSLTSTDDTNFIELMRVSEGVIQSQQLYPALSELNKTLARRTYDQSGSFAVTPFSIHLVDDANTKYVNANSSLYYIGLDPGKAYVQGFEYESVAQKTLSAPKARTTANVASNQIITYFGNHLKIQNIKGSFDFPSLVSVDLHCVGSENVATANAAVYSNTKIGTARIRAMEYDSAANTSNNLTLVYRAHIFDVNTASIVSNTISATSNTITFGALFSTVANAYYNMFINVPSTGDTRYITSYNGSTLTATVNTPWSSIPNTGNQFNILGDISQTESLGLSNVSSYVTANANINIGSKLQSAPYHTTSLTDNSFQTLVFKFPTGPIQVGSINSQSFRYRAKIGSVTLPPNTLTNISLSLTDGTASLTSPGISGSDTVALTDFIVVANTTTNPSIITMVSGKGRTLSVAGDGKSVSLTTSASDPTFTNVDVYASIVSQLASKTKTFVSANTIMVGQSGGTFVTAANANVFLSLGQVVFSNTAQTSLGIAGSPQDIFISDANNIVCIIDSGALGTPVSNAMIQAAVASSSSAFNITNRFTFFNGQKDSYYDHATLTLNSGYAAPAGQVAVLVNYYSHSATGGYFIADSYPDYTNIPTFSSQSSGSSVPLRDALDFRPRRTDATTAMTFNSGVPSIIPEPLVTSGFSSNFAYYLPRVDKVFLSKDGTFDIIQGIPSTNPYPPNIPDGAMLLYTLAIPPYTFNTKQIRVQATDNRRYTMRDIGALEKRIRALEYYATLSALEKSATSESIVDGNGLQRPKNGILTDSFKGTAVADVKNLDYFCAIDQESQELRPAFTTNAFSLDFDSANSSNYSRSSKIFTLSWTPATFIDQPLASRIENVNPYNVVVWNGMMQLDPESDIWIDTTQLPDVITNLSGENDAWAAIGQLVNNSTDPRSPFSTVWNNWQTVWSGVNVLDQSTSFSSPYIGGSTTDWWGGTQFHPWGTYLLYQDQITSTTTSQTDVNIRTGIQTSLASEVITKSLGNKIVSSNIIPYIRSRPVYFVAQSMRPLITVYPYFDSVNVSNYVAKTNEIVFTSNTALHDDYGNEEIISCGANTARVLYSTLSSGNTKAYVSDVTGIISAGQVWSSVNGTLTVATYRQCSGVVVSANTTNVRLQSGSLAGGASYVGNTLYIVSGTGYGQSANITAYDGTGNVTVSPAFATAPANNSIYSIGALSSDNNGVVAGVFVIPSNNTLRFRIGERLFRLIDDPNNNPAAATTKAEDKYTAQGTLQTLQQDVVSTRVPTLRTQTVSQSETVTSNPVTTQIAGTNFVDYYDPLAQNILVDGNTYPDGIFITKLKLVFRGKDNFVPVTVQIRPVVNGFPHSSQILPLSETTLRPDQVNTTLDPTGALDDATKYTSFVFDAPLYLLPGTEYSIVVVSNSNNYEIYSALVGEKMIGSDRVISSAPYLGSMFKSQNASTWTPFQGENFMFRMEKAVFSTVPGFVTFKKPAYVANTLNNLIPSANVYVDTMYVGTSDKLIKNTGLYYGYRAVANSTGILDTAYSSLSVNENFNFNSRKVISTTNNSFFLQGTMATSNPDVSPIVDLERMSVLAIANQINANTSGEAGAARGGAALSKYITRRVTLASGMDAGDLNVFFEGHKPAGSQVYVYYKILSAEDNDQFDNKNYVLMSLDSTDTFSAQDNDFIEYAYVGGLDASGDPVRNISYSTFTSFKTFAVKIVLTSTDPTIIPRLKNLRVIAMPRA